MGRKQNNQYNFAINCCFAEEQDAWITCKQQLIIAMREKKCLLQKKQGSSVFLKFTTATFPSLTRGSLKLTSTSRIVFQVQHKLKFNNPFYKMV